MIMHPTRKLGRRLLQALLGTGLTVGVVVLGRWIAERREIAATCKHQAALAQAAEAPGTLVPDPVLPADAVEVELIATFPELRPLEPATVHAGVESSPWAVDAPAHFGGPRDPLRTTISVAGPYLAEAASFDLPTGPHGARIDVRVLPIEPQPPVEPLGTSRPEQTLEIDLTGPDALRIRWKVGHTLVSEGDLPRAPDATRLGEEWKRNGQHHEPLDRRRDPVVVRVAPSVRFDNVVPLIAALLATRREIESRDGDMRTIPVFRVSVQRLPEEEGGRPSAPTP